MNTNTKHNEYIKQGVNPKHFVVFTSNGKVLRPNPNYDPSRCQACGEKKGIFGHTCKGGR